MRVTLRELKELIKESNWYDDEGGRWGEDDPGPYETPEDRKQRHDAELSMQKGTFLVFFTNESGERLVSVSKDMFDARDSGRVHRAVVRKLEGGYSGDEFEEGTYDVNELDLGEDDGFFWDAENHPIVMIT